MRRLSRPVERSGSCDVVEEVGAADHAGAGRMTSTAAAAVRSLRRRRRFWPRSDAALRAPDRPDRPAPDPPGRPGPPGPPGPPGARPRGRARATGARRPRARRPAGAPTDAAPGRRARRRTTGTIAAPTTAASRRPPDGPTGSRRPTRGHRPRRRGPRYGHTAASPRTGVVRTRWRSARQHAVTPAATRARAPRCRRADRRTSSFVTPSGRGDASVLGVHRCVAS